MRDENTASGSFPTVGKRWRLIVVSWLPVLVALAAGLYVLSSIESRRAELAAESARLAEIREQLKKADAQRKALLKEKEKLQREVWEGEGEVRDREQAIAALKDKQRNLEKTLELKDPDLIVKKLRTQFASATSGQKADILFRRGKDAYDAGDLELAERLFLEATKEDASFAPPRNGLGLVEAKRGHLSVAERHFKSAVGVDPKYVHGWFNLAHVNQLMKQPARSKEYAERALQIDPEYAPARELLRRLATQQGPP